MGLNTIWALAVTAVVSAEWCDPAERSWCAGDPDLFREWEPPMPRGSTKWSARERDAVRAWLAGERRTAGDLALPKVYVYPFPEEFEKFRAFLETVPRLQLRRFPLNATYFDFAAGLDAPSRDGETWGPWDRSKDRRGAEWRPSVDAVGHWSSATGSGQTCAKVERGLARESECVYTGFSQHALGLAIHRSLESYPRLAEDPRDADLFFVPDHFISTRMEKTHLFRERWCALVGPAWHRHLRKFHVPGRSSPTAPATSYLQRRGGNDHFFAVGRAFHHRVDVKAFENLKVVEEYGGAEDCAYRWSGFRGMHRLVLESQYNVNRRCHKIHPVPYQGFLPWANRRDWGAAWFGSTRTRPRTAAAYFTVADESGKLPNKDASGTRSAFARACADWAACDLRGGEYNWYAEGYRNTTFTLQPPGHSAVRKGIVDSLLAGAIPVLAAADAARSRVSAKDQRDVWPWHWPAQGATSIVLDATQLADIPGALDQVDDEQIDLMRRVIAAVAPSLAYPIAAQAEDLGDAAPPEERSPNALELLLHGLWAASKTAETPETVARCDAFAEAVFAGAPEDLAVYRDQQALARSFAAYLAQTHKSMLVKWMDGVG